MKTNRHTTIETDNTQVSNNEYNIVVLLRVCTILLAVVSFWATAQGMAEYTFPQGWQAYAASLGVQGLLLGLNFALPSFLRNCQNTMQRVILLILTLVILSCSSWFSYLYIAKQAYKDSWKTESQLLAQNIYREELFDANDYTMEYSQKLEQVIGNQITELYKMASEIGEKTINAGENTDWNNERSIYAPEGSPVRTQMLNVIDVMERSVESEDQSTRENAKDIIEGTKTNFDEQTNNLNDQIKNAESNVERAQSLLENAQRNLRNANRYENTAGYQTALTNAQNNLNNSQSRLNELENELQVYEEAAGRINYYETILEINESGATGYSVGSNLREMQKEFFAENTDMEKIMSLANSIYDTLQNNVDFSSEGNYQNFLAKMNDFRINLSNYNTLKNAGDELSNHINSLANGEILLLDIGETPLISTEATSVQTTEITSTATTEVSTAETTTTEADADSKKEIEEDNTWRSEWAKQFNELKAVISNIPAYTLDEEGSKILTSFDRTDSTGHLDNAIRRYLTGHNGAQQGLIYLGSPYRGIAIFSLILAFLLDIAAFITGFIIDKTSSEIKDNDEVSATKEGTDEIILTGNNYTSTQNNIQTLNRYLFFTGDYVYIDGVMTYRVIEDGQLTEINCTLEKVDAGLYIWKDNTPVKPEDNSPLLFKGVSEGPQDGVYSNCSIIYSNQLILLKKDDKSNFIGNADPDMPVHIISDNKYDIIPIKNMAEAKCKKLIVSLNSDGTYIATVYVIQ